MNEISAGLGTMISGSGTAQTGFNSLQMTDDQLKDLEALQAITTQLEALASKYAAS